MLGWRGPKPEFIRLEGASVASPCFSPDGDWIAVVSRTPPNHHRLFLVPFKRGVVADRKQWIEATAGAEWVDKPRWSGDGNILYFITERDGSSRIWGQHLNPSSRQPVGPPFEVWRFEERGNSLDNIDGLDLTVIENSLLFSARVSVGNIWRMTLYNRDR
jgi:hypothetical protein